MHRRPSRIYYQFVVSIRPLPVYTAATCLPLSPWALLCNRLNTGIVLCVRGCRRVRKGEWAGENFLSAFFKLISNMLFCFPSFNLETVSSPSDVFRTPFSMTVICRAYCTICWHKSYISKAEGIQQNQPLHTQKTAFTKPTILYGRIVAILIQISLLMVCDRFWVTIHIVRLWRVLLPEPRPMPFSLFVNNVHPNLPNIVSIFDFCRSVVMNWNEKVSQTHPTCTRDNLVIWFIVS